MWSEKLATFMAKNKKWLLPAFCFLYNKLSFAGENRLGISWFFTYVWSLKAGKFVNYYYRKNALEKRYNELYYYPFWPLKQLRRTFSEEIWEIV